MQLTKQASVTDSPQSTNREMKHIVKHRKPYQLIREKPRRLIFLGLWPYHSEIQSCTANRLFYLKHSNLIIATDVGTSFRNGEFLNKLSVVSIFDNIRMFWININVGTTDYIHTSVETNFSLEKLKAIRQDFSTLIRIAITEVHVYIGKRERSYGYMCTKPEIVCVSARRISEAERLSLTFRALSDVTYSNTKKRPATLRFWAFPRLWAVCDRGSSMQTAAIIKGCIAIVARQKFKEKLKYASRVRSTQSHTEFEMVWTLPSGHIVLVFR